MNNIFNVITNKNLKDKMVIGFILSNKNEEVLLIKRKIDRINKEIYDIPYVNTNKNNEKEILKEVNSKYGINLKNVLGYIDETVVLDDECNTVPQINMHSSIDENDINNQLDYKWEKIDNLINSDIITDSLKNSIEIYKYNKNL